MVWNFGFLDMYLEKSEEIDALFSFSLGFLDCYLLKLQIVPALFGGIQFFSFTFPSFSCFCVHLPVSKFWPKWITFKAFKDSISLILFLMFLNVNIAFHRPQKYHKDVLEHMASRVPVAVLPPPLPPSIPPPALSNEPPVTAVETAPERPVRKIQPGRRRERRSGSRRHRKVVAGSRDTESS